ncbi:thermonuclease family protein [Capillimicrobium parvum]|uniref:Thermonuclease n=1 Tax=Capillimicrobium parvum TaxID=2884022 RepID=A0A9E6XVR6_9ACTN|nr:thermonuclease family protein [Capillimicrobium parvum]UGS34672.1 Thermonuclease [Capillimicrobium parvum]
MPRRAVITVVVLIVAVFAARLAAQRSDRAPKGVAGEVTRVVDGDTIHVDLDGTDETVRYIGIDTPESVKPGTPVQCFAKRASAHNEQLVGGEDVRLRFDVERRDRYGRLLAYVYRVGDGTFVNAALVRDGYARTLTVPPNVRYADRFAQLQRQAREHRRGLWQAC